MIRRQNFIDSYSRVKIEGSSPMGLIYILYDGAISDLQEARRALHGRDRDKFSKSLLHAQDCIRELRASLKFDEPTAEEIAANLYRLYSFCINQLIEANLARSNHDQYFQTVLNILVQLKTSWQEGERKLKGAKPEMPERRVSISA